MYAFQASIHARPEVVSMGDPLALAGQSICPLVFPREALATTAMPVSFEEAYDALRQIERLFCEPDGSFVWTSPQPGTHWQLDGNLYDRAGRLLLVDLQGSCPQEAFDRLLEPLGWPQAPLMFQLKREAVFLDEDAFRRLAEALGTQAG
ncbi:MAG: hypothetical protein DWQ37_20610 [Planctomycetota bacterium]|nr:MAG: hypothetical protein DWQ37_20610 [Planctomycetota bacterium]